jgi:cytosine/adenosine deaminase-related metal-dependent hydrolase
MIYTADYILTMNAPPIENGAVRVHGKHIEEVGPARDIVSNSGETVRRLSETVLMPGLINCHCHLELGGARGLFPEKESFSMWVSRLQKHQEGLSQEDYVNAIGLGGLECIRTGTTTVLDIGNTGTSFKVLPRERIRSFPVFEFMGLDPEQGLKNFQAQMARFQDFHPETFPDRCRPSVSAHSLYACSEQLIRAVLEAHKQFDIPFSIHLAESEEEWNYFTRMEGMLFNLCKRKYPSLPDLFMSPYDYLWQKDLLPDSSLAVHCNIIGPDDAGLLAQKNASIVHCPRSQGFFGHPEFSFSMCRDFGINICLGTDSLASNESLNMFEEMAEFKKKHPQVESGEIIEMATVNPAKALRKQGKLGKIQKGYFADFIGINVNHDHSCNIYDEIVNEDHETTLVVIDGEEVLA